MKSHQKIIGITILLTCSIYASMNRCFVPDSSEMNRINQAAQYCEADLPFDLLEKCEWDVQDGGSSHYVGLKKLGLYNSSVIIRRMCFKVEYDSTPGIGFQCFKDEIDTIYPLSEKLGVGTKLKGKTSNSECKKIQTIMNACNLQESDSSGIYSIEKKSANEFELLYSKYWCRICGDRPRTGTSFKVYLNRVTCPVIRIDEYSLDVVYVVKDTCECKMKIE